MSEDFLQHALGAVGTALYIARAIPSTVQMIAGLLPAAATLLILRRGGKLHGRSLRLLVAGIALVPIAIADSRLAAVTAAVLGALIAVPEGVSLVRDPERADEDVSFTMWLLVAVNAVVWLAYGIMVEHPVLGLAGLVQLPTALVICWRARRPSGVIQPGSPSAQLQD